MKGLIMGKHVWLIRIQFVVVWQWLRLFTFFTLIKITPSLANSIPAATSNLGLNLSTTTATTNDNNDNDNNTKNENDKHSETVPAGAGAWPRFCWGKTGNQFIFKISTLSALMDQSEQVLPTMWPSCGVVFIHSYLHHWWSSISRLISTILTCPKDVLGWMNFSDAGMY